MIKVLRCCVYICGTNETQVFFFINIHQGAVDGPYALRTGILRSGEKADRPAPGQ